MAMPQVTLRVLLEAGVHFGHHTRRWNPRMAPYIFGIRNQVHILDLQQTVPLMDRALRAIRDTVAGGGRVLFVGTKKAAAEYVAESATRCGQYYVNHRWLGGMPWPSANWPHAGWRWSSNSKPRWAASRIWAACRTSSSSSTW